MPFGPPVSRRWPSAPQPTSQHGRPAAGAGELGALCKEDAVWDLSQTRGELATALPDANIVKICGKLLITWAMTSSDASEEPHC
eukprot:6455885-Amphidinium_carterae.1